MDKKPVHVAMFSGGASSAYVAYLMVQLHGKDNSILFFTDTLWEDEDNMRFMEEVSQYIGVPFYIAKDGRSPEEVFIETRFLGNSRLAKCSSELKVKQTVLFIEEELRRNRNLEPILYFGIGAHEKHRAGNISELYAHNLFEPVETRFPLIDLNLPEGKAREIIENEWQIKLPRLYYENFAHANCGGRCVRGGHNHYRNLFIKRRHLYLAQEDMENRLRTELGNVTILKRKGQPLTLEKYRQELEELERTGKLNDTKQIDDDVPCVCIFT